MIIQNDTYQPRITHDHPSNCRYCAADLGGEDLLVEAIRMYPNDPIRALARAQQFGWTPENKLRWVRTYRSLHTPEGIKMLCWVSGVCDGIEPLDYNAAREWLVNGKVSPFKDGGIIKERGAIFSEDKKYRYSLWRIWEPSMEKVAFLMLNPSVANTNDDDPTTQRCIEFAKKFGYGGLYIVNLYGYIDTVKEHLRGLPLEVARGPENRANIQDILSKVSRVIYAYGTAIVEPGPEPEWLKELVPNPYCLDHTKEGYPHHPGRLSGDVTLKPFRRIDVSGGTMNVFESIFRAAAVPLPSSPPPEEQQQQQTVAEPQENKNEYIKFLKEQHPIVKAANPTLEPKEIITKVGHLWSLIQMTIEIKNDHVLVTHKNKKVLLDGCGKPNELKSYLDGYRAKYRHEALYNLVDNLPKAN